MNQTNRNQGSAKKGSVPVTNGRNNQAKNGKLEPLKKNDRTNSPTLRGGKHKVVPGIKDDKIKEKEQAALMASILSGKFTDLPPKRPTEVRVFLSSTFADMREERNILMRRANPELKEYCFTEHDLDFSMVDMRWGVTDEATNDHSTEEICLREIHNCQRVGLGPTFVTILGDRYGYRPIPKTLEVTEMDDAILPEVCDKRRVDLLHKWYRRDDNAQPPKYVLQSVTTHIPEFGTSPAADDQWYSEQTDIGETLRSAVQKAKVKGKVTATREHEYNMSVTESEIREGLVKAKQPEMHCLGFLRRFKDLDNDALKAEKSAAKRYIDNTKDVQNMVVVDTDVARLRQNLHSEVVPKGLASSNIYKYPLLDWDTKGVAPNGDGQRHKDHRQYIENFCKDFTVGLKTLVEREKRETRIHAAKTKYYSNFDEILHHVHFVEAKVATFRGQGEILAAVKNHMVESSSGRQQRVPLVIHAESGGGKTSIMAKIFELLPVWFGKDKDGGGGVSRVIRFLGTSPLSTEIYDVLWSIVGQVADNYGEIVQPSCYKTLKGLVAFLPRFLRTLLKKENNKKSSERLVILLDSVDQLSGRNDAFKMRWLPTELPANVHIIISTIPDLHGGILDNCRKIGIPESAMLEVSALNEAEGKEIVTAYLEKADRCVQPAQEAAIVEAYREVKNMLYLKLLMDKAVNWNSYTTVDKRMMSDIGLSVRAAINHLFATLETKFGRVLVAHTLGYLTTGLSGLTSVELEDALSCDNEVLDRVYQYHPPPVEGIIRLPPVLWPRIKYDIEEYLTERNSQGKNTLYWYHRQFIEAAQERYASADEAGRRFHRDLAALFLAEEEVKKSITLTSPRVKRTIENADRQISKHPVISDNRRTLVATCYHFQNSEDTEAFKRHVFFNYRFLLAKIQAEGVKAVLDEIAKLGKQLKSRSELVYDFDLEMLRACLLEFDEDERSRTKVRSQILCSVPRVSWLPMSGRLREQAMEEVLAAQGAKEQTPLLLPLHPFLFYKANLAEEYHQPVPGVREAHGNVLCCFPAKEEKIQRTNLIYIGQPQNKKPVQMRYGGVAGIVCLSHNDPSLCVAFRDGPYYSAKSLLYPYLHINKTTYRVSDDSPGKLMGNSSGTTIKADFIEHDKRNAEYKLDDASFSTRDEVNVFRLGRDYVALHGFTPERSKYRMTFKIASKGGEKPKKKLDDTHKWVGVNATVVDIKFALHSDVFDKTLVGAQCQGESGGGDIALLVVLSFRESKLVKSALELPGKLYDGCKPQLTGDDKTLMFAVEDTTKQQHKIYKYSLETNQYSSILIEASVVKAYSFTSIGPLIWYALTANKILGYDCTTETQCFSVDFDSGLATALRVEDDGEFVYIGDSEGLVHAWQVDCSHYLGHVNCGHGSGIRGIYLSQADINVAVHTADDALLTIPQRHFVDQCVRNTEGERRKRENEANKDKHLLMAPSDELDKLGTVTIVQIVHNQQSEVLLTFERGHCKVWRLETLEKIKEILYYSGKKEAKEDVDEFAPTRVLYDRERRLCLVHDEKKALILDTTSLADFSPFHELTSDILASAHSPQQQGFWLLTKKQETKQLSLNMIETSSLGGVTVTMKTLAMKESLTSENFELMVTPSGKYAVLKVRCGERELEIIEASEKKMSGAAEMGGDFKFYAVNISKPHELTVNPLIPCLKNLSKVLCLGQTCVMYQDSTVLILLPKSISFWDIEAKKNLPRLVKGKNTPMFELVTKERATDDSYAMKPIDIAYNTDAKLFVSIIERTNYDVNKTFSHSSLDVYKESGDHVTPNWGKAKPNNTLDILEKVAISPDGTYAVTSSQSNLLKCWHVAGCCKETSCIQLDVKVMQITFNPSSKYVAILGQGDKRTKVMVLQVKH